VESGVISTKARGYTGYTDSPTFAVLGPLNENQFRYPVMTSGSAKPLEAAIAEQLSD
jgi:hypothetical protein